MTSRPGIRPSRFGLIARLAVTVVVAAGAMTGAVLVHSTPAVAAGHSTEATPDPSVLAQGEASRLLAIFVPPPGADRLSGAPSGLPPSAVPADAAMPYQVASTAWWRTTQTSAADAISWVGEHPEQGLTAVAPGAQAGSGVASSITFSGTSTDPTINGITLTVTAYPAVGGATVLSVAADVAYRPARPSTEALPPATQLIVVPTFGLNSKQSAPEVTVTDVAEIGRIEAVINGLSKAETGGISCPMDNGAGMALVFEGAQNATLADVVVSATGCGNVQVSISGYTEPTLAGGRQAAALIQRILGTNWDLSQVPTS
ncbi:hypothetical protein KDL01_21155 [Actinospica durhamensis]|uniref:Uncharacterized protein n=1 Tax=Actinospica durhamensis TaxID=1508375 RepID=A0A941EQX7_9ACTN|nr:hypothetical protein [Actinospica durhamensis]MBR7835795.1 hypothetical protein [Actinospica durhamensis]